MYNNPTAKQIAHLVRKKPKGFVYQFGNTDMRIPMTYYKAHLPKLVAPTDPKSLWEELGYSWVTTNRKADIVVCGDMLRKNFNVNNAMNDIPICYDGFVPIGIILGKIIMKKLNLY